MVLSPCCKTKRSQLTLAGPHHASYRELSSEQGEARSVSSAPPAPSASDERTCSSEPGGRGRSPRARRGSSLISPAGACRDAGWCSRPPSRRPSSSPGSSSGPKTPFASPSSFSATRPPRSLRSLSRSISHECAPRLASLISLRDRLEGRRALAVVFKAPRSPRGLSRVPRKDWRALSKSN